MSYRYSIVDFKVKANTGYGQVVHVSGSSFTLGNFNPTEAVALVTTPEEYPIWRTAHSIVVPRDVPQAYKYAIFENGRFKRWENLELARIICPSGPKEEVVDEFDVDQEIFDSEEALTDGSTSTGKESFGSTPDGKKNITHVMRRNISEKFGLQGSPRPQFDSRKLLESQEYSPPPGSRLHLVCFHLPVTISKNGRGQWTAAWNESLIAKTENSISSEMTTHWIGTVAVRNLSESDKVAITAILEPMNCTPIYLDEKVVDLAYYGYSKEVLWPLFHNVEMLDTCSAVWHEKDDDPERAWDLGKKEGWWEAYIQVNDAFQRACIDRLKENDVLWVHDYHLMLLPGKVARYEEENYGRRSCNIIFFLHIPFPTSQIFRALHNGEDLLRGVLAADVVGFHAFDHTRHFLNACKRIMGIQFFNKPGGLIGIEFESRTVTVLISHVGIEGQQLEVALADPGVIEAAAALKAKHAGKVLVAGLDTCQRLAGISLKILAFERLLNDYPQFREHVVLVQRSLLPNNRLEDDEITKSEVQELVDRVNKQFGPVVDYELVPGSEMAMRDRLPLWIASDILTITAIREGLNLNPLEFTFVKKGDVSRAGIVLASEFSACSSVLNGAIRINPFDIQKMSQALDHALHMDEGERARRRDRDIPYIGSRPSGLWTRQVLQDLWATKADTGMPQLSSSHSRAFSTTVLQASSSLMEKICIPDVVEAYKSSSRRFIFTDFGGTLMEKENVDLYIKRSMTQTTGKRPSPQMMQALKKLSEDPHNEVFVISGLQFLPLEEVFGNIDGLGLAAGNGLYVSMPYGDEVRPEKPTSREGSVSLDGSGDGAQARKGKKRMWNLLDYGVKWNEVKDIALPILERYTARTNGSSVRLRDPGIAWSYYSCDPEWGAMQAKAVIVELQEALSAHDVKVVHLKGMVEVVPKRLNKGVVLRYAIQNRAAAPPEFILCMGDDASDEYMFTSIYSYISEMSDTLGEKGLVAEEVKYVFTCAVGKRQSHASFYAQNSAEIEELLISLEETIA